MIFSSRNAVNIGDLEGKGEGRAHRCVQVKMQASNN